MEGRRRFRRWSIPASALLVLSAAALHCCASSGKTKEQQQVPEAGKTAAFESYRNLIFLPVRVNGSRPLCFVLDSGSGTGMIDKARAKELGLKLAEGGQGIGLGEGTLGYPIFARYVVAVDNEKHNVTFFNPKTYVHKGRGEKIPLTIENHVPYVTAKLKLYGQDAEERRYIIDTGSASTTVAD